MKETIQNHKKPIKTIFIIYTHIYLYQPMYG